nr:MAG TPA: hypothetical protein [Bacteriophage sp.]
MWYRKQAITFLQVNDIFSNSEYGSWGVWT